MLEPAAMRHAPRPGALALTLTMLLLCSAHCNAQMLYRCTAADGSVAWQDAACAPGSQQHVRPYQPVPVGAGARQPSHDAAAPRAPARTRAGNAAHSAVRAAAPRQVRAIDRAEHACVQARARAQARSDAQGLRLRLREIRQREAEARAACGD